MAITYTWKITGLKTREIAGTPGAVVQTYWEKIGTDEEGNEGKFSGATPFTPDPTDTSGPFIPFEDLTEQDVIGWIQTVVVGSYEEHVNGKIQEQIDAKKSPIVDAPMPWAPPPAPTPEPPVPPTTP
jgi:hypothetical protein